MGLDQYMYVAAQAGQRKKFYETGSYDSENHEFTNPDVEEPREIGYRRKHPNLQGWMERLWEEKGRPGAREDEEHPMFNGVELELTWSDIERLYNDVVNDQLPATTGFFYGEGSDEYYKKDDLEFVKQARAELFLGLKVFYNSSW
jgi:hypothetical protein